MTVLTPHTLEQLVATATEMLATSMLANGLAEHALSEGWDPDDVELVGGDLEYLRGQHDDSPEGLPLEGEAQEALEDAVLSALPDVLRAAITRHADKRARDPETTESDATAAAEWLKDHASATYDALEAAALERLRATLVSEVEALEPGEALCWDADAGRANDDAGSRRELTDRDWAVARLASGSIDFGWDHSQGRWAHDLRDLSSIVLDWWAAGLGRVGAAIVALRGGESALSTLPIAVPGSEDDAPETVSLYEDNAGGLYLIDDATGHGYELSFAAEQGLFVADAAELRAGEGHVADWTAPRVAYDEIGVDSANPNATKLIATYSPDNGGSYTLEGAPGVAGRAYLGLAPEDLF